MYQQLLKSPLSTPPAKYFQVYTGSVMKEREDDIQPLPAPSLNVRNTIFWPCHVIRANRFIVAHAPSDSNTPFWLGKVLKIKNNKHPLVQWYTQSGSKQFLNGWSVEKDSIPSKIKKGAIVLVLDKHFKAGHGFTEQQQQYIDSMIHHTHKL